MDEPAKIFGLYIVYNRERACIYRGPLQSNKKKVNTLRESSVSSAPY